MRYGNMPSPLKGVPGLKKTENSSNCHGWCLAARYVKPAWPPVTSIAHFHRHFDGVDNVDAWRQG